MGEKVDDTQIKVDIGVLKRDVQYLTEQAVRQDKKQDDIIKRIDDLVFVSQSVCDKFKEEHEAWKETVEKRLNDTLPSVKFYSALSSKWMQVIIGATILGIVYILINQFSKLGGLI